MPGQWIVIAGAGAGGGVGALRVQYAKAMGHRVIASDMGENKRAFCIESGAEIYADSNTHNLREAVGAATNQRSVSAAIVVAGSAAAYQEGPFGTLVCVGVR